MAVSNSSAVGRKPFTDKVHEHVKPESRKYGTEKYAENVTNAQDEVAAQQQPHYQKSVLQQAHDDGHAAKVNTAQANAANPHSGGIIDSAKEGAAFLVNSTKSVVSQAAEKIGHRSRPDADAAAGSVGAPPVETHRTAGTAGTARTTGAVGTAGAPGTTGSAGTAGAGVIPPPTGHTTANPLHAGHVAPSASNAGYTDTTRGHAIPTSGGNVYSNAGGHHGRKLAHENAVPADNSYVAGANNSTSVPPTTGNTYR